MVSNGPLNGDGRNGSPSNATELPVDSFRGVVLCVVPPHKLTPSMLEKQDSTGQGDCSNIGVIFLGNGETWVRVNFYGGAAERVTDISEDSETALEVRGRKNDKWEITDFYVFEEDDETGIGRVDEQVTYTPSPMSGDEIADGSLVEMAVVEVVESLIEEYRTGDIKVQHLTVATDDGQRRSTKFAVDLFDHHVRTPASPGDTLYIFAGWATPLEKYLHPRLDRQYDHKAKFKISNYSGVRNVSKNPIPGDS